MGIDPIHANQIQTTDRPVRNACGDVWFQHEWQSVGKISRETLALVIGQAETQVADYLNYWPLPRWIIQEEKRTTRPNVTTIFSSGFNTRSLRKSVDLDFKHVLSGGVRGADVIEASSSVTYSDDDGDGYDEVATITVTIDPDVVSACEISVFYPGEAAADEWEIRPLTVSISGTTATIVGRKYQFVLKDLLENITLEGTDNTAVDGDDNTNFLGSVDVYRIYNDPSQQATLIWERPDTGQISTQTGFLNIRDSRRGIAAYLPGTWDATDEQFDINVYTLSREPDRMQVWYRAGLQDRTKTCPTRQMNYGLELRIARLAMTYLEDKICGCDSARTQFEYWRTDMSRVADEESFQITPAMSENPFGPTRAGVHMWKYLNAGEHRIGTAATE
jgi:hypothetical protein